MHYSKTVRKRDFDAWSDHAGTVTSLLLTNFVDEMCWRRVCDVDDRFTTMKEYQQEKKSQRHIDSGTKIFKKSSSLSHQHSNVINITVTACGIWNLTKKYEKSENDWGDMNSRDSNLTISGTKWNPRWNIINDPNYKINGSICVRRLYPRKVIMHSLCSIGLNSGFCSFPMRGASRSRKLKASKHQVITSLSWDEHIEKQIGEFMAEMRSERQHNSEFSGFRIKNFENFILKIM